jgi:hypothetical protein
LQEALATFFFFVFGIWQLHVWKSTFSSLLQKFLFSLCFYFSVCFYFLRVFSSFLFDFLRFFRLLTFCPFYNWILFSFKSCFSLSFWFMLKNFSPFLVVSCWLCHFCSINFFASKFSLVVFVLLFWNWAQNFYKLNTLELFHQNSTAGYHETSVSDKRTFPGAYTTYLLFPHNSPASHELSKLCKRSLHFFFFFLGGGGQQK